MTLTAANIAELTSGTLHGNPNVEVSDVSSLLQSKPDTLSFLGDLREVKQLDSTRAAIVLVPANCDPSQIAFSGKALITTADPYSAFISLIPKFRPSNSSRLQGVSQWAIIDETAEIASDVAIGAQAIIGAGCKIGNRCQIHPGAQIGSNVTLGDDVIVYPNVVIYPTCQLGDRVIVHANAVLGADGFGYQFQGGAFHKIEHYGSVIVEEDVEIGASATIDRGMIDDTVIGRGTKIDNHVMIAHNCRIGAHNVIVSQVGLAGSVTTGDYCRFGGQVGIADHVTIGEGATLMAQAGVFRDIPAGETMLGAPANPMQEQKKIFMAQMKLPEMRISMRKMQKRIQALEQELAALTEEQNQTAAEHKPAKAA